MNFVPYIVSLAAMGLILVTRKMRHPAPMILLPLASTAILLCLWQIGAEAARYPLTDKDGTLLRIIEVFPTPWSTLVGMEKPITDGVLLRHIVASVYRVAAGFLLAAGIGIPLGLWAGWNLRAYQALNPLVEALRPISPIAWIPVAILWFGVNDEAAIFLIALASFFPIVTGTITAVNSIPAVYVRSAQNFGLGGVELFRRVVFPASMPQIITSCRFALGIAWLVIVAAEMTGIDRGLGYMVLDARNANNYDRVVGAMIVIGIIGIALDFGMRRLERLDEVRWGYPKKPDQHVAEQTRLKVDAKIARAGLKKAVDA